MLQNTNKVLMVRPISFGFNAETAVNNHYQVNDNRFTEKEIQEKAVQEFDNLVATLRNEGVDVKVLQDTKDPHTPDSVFPNNWFSTHEDKKVVLYPMYAHNRRLERTEKLFDFLAEPKENLEIIDMTDYEDKNIFLEGTGSMILDRQNKKVYMCLSARADEKVLDAFCENLGYKKVVFHGYQSHEGQRKAIYHTNVMMGLAEKYAIICLDAIDDKAEREKVIKELEEDNKEIIAISEEQVNNFLGNNLELQGKDSKLCVMSDTAYNVLTAKQKAKIEKYAKIVHSAIPTIENYGGGSVRCMLAELFI